MRRDTRQLLNAYLDRQAELNDEDGDAIRRGASFAIEPSVQQKLIDKDGENSAFLAGVNIVPVEELRGSKLGLGVNQPIASRTNTEAVNSTGRKTIDPSGLDEEGYELFQTNSDTHLTYAKLDMWAKFPDFEPRISNAISRQKSRDRLMIGFNGTHAAPNTDKAANPLLQDVNKGWLQHYRDYKGGERVLDEGETEDGKIIIDPTTGDYKNLHALIKDAIFTLMPSWSRDDEGLVAILGAQLEHDTFFPLVNTNLVPTETLAADLILSAKRVGGKNAVAASFFPALSIFITRQDNLSIYEQEGKRRRTVKENAAFNRVETFESTNEGYVVEDYDYGCLIENIQFGATPGQGG
ncbi:phage major capsid protein, P2 family [Brevundimonas nasdae]|uniref:phage major capsid protein, P2 family n=1 Tax=Brevundimonas nasdae TaxID=172043 RepID=UPI003F68D985